jgi:XTP/dITP diphosphohydrolase
MKKLLLASNNEGKLRELRALLEGLELDLLDPGSLMLKLEVEESGDDYASNASLKAAAFSSASSMWCLADDSGLEVDALGGAPGLHSARLVGPKGSDQSRRTYLLSLLVVHPRPWTARFRSVVALASPEGAIDLAEGECPGEVIPDERGDMGFGYDPIFLLQGMDRTMAELEMEEKNRHSHRAHAVQEILPILRKRLGLDASKGSETDAG